MRAIVYTAPKTLEFQDEPEPEPRDGDVIVEVQSVGICGSELEGFRSVSPFRVPPLIMGHEFSGVRLDTGESVTVNPLVSCRSCDLCLRGEPNLCRDRAIVGIHRPGAFAELVSVPELNCHPLPDGVDFHRGALVEPLAAAAHAVRLSQAHDPAPVRVGVIGAGMIGVGIALTARRRGVTEVVVVDRVQDRLDIAMNAGATHTGSRLDGEFDVVFDAVGSAQTRADALAALRPGGTTVWIGLHGPASNADGLDLIRSEKRIIGTFCYHDQDIKAAIELSRSFDLDWLDVVPLEEGVQAFMNLLDDVPRNIKTILTTE